MAGMMASRADADANAKALATQIVAADPRQPDALRELGEISLMQGLWDEARDYADEESLSGRTTRAYSCWPRGWRKRAAARQPH